MGSVNETGLEEKWGRSSDQDKQVAVMVSGTRGPIVCRQLRERYHGPDKSDAGMSDQERSKGLKMSADTQNCLSARIDLDVRSLEMLMELRKIGVNY